MSVENYVGEYDITMAAGHAFKLLNVTTKIVINKNHTDNTDYPFVAHIASNNLGDETISIFMQADDNENLYGAYPPGATEEDADYRVILSGWQDGLSGDKLIFGQCYVGDPDGVGGFGGQGGSGGTGGSDDDPDSGG